MEGGVEAAEDRGASSVAAGEAGVEQAVWHHFPQGGEGGHRPQEAGDQACGQALPGVGLQ